MDGMNTPPNESISINKIPSVSLTATKGITSSQKINSGVLENRDLNVMNNPKISHIPDSVKKVELPQLNSNKPKNQADYGIPSIPQKTTEPKKQVVVPIKRELDPTYTKPTYSKLSPTDEGREDFWSIFQIQKFTTYSTNPIQEPRSINARVSTHIDEQKKNDREMTGEPLKVVRVRFPQYVAQTIWNDFLKLREAISSRTVSYVEFGGNAIEVYVSGIPNPLYRGDSSRTMADSSTISKILSAL